MRNGKRIISILLVIALFVGLIPPTTVLAEDANQSVIDNSSLSVEGTNGFGTLLSEAITEEQETADAEENIYPGGYTVTDLSVEGNVATVTYDSLEKANLVVAVYTEDGMKMLASGTATVSPEETEAVVTIEGDMPEYFMASAYLLDTYDYSPLCASYDTPMYTREMQELLVSTIDDYDTDKVLNLDDDKTTNFAVYAETTKVIEYAEGINTVISADDETVTYVIGNADESITSLQAGDVLAYVYGENQILIVKVASVTVDGTTATITGDDLEMEEVFSHVKVESYGDTEDIIVDETTGDEDITYVGMVTDEAAVMSLRDPYAINPIGDYTGKLSLGFELEKEDGSITYSGSLKLNLKIDFSYYVSKSRQFVELEIDTETKLAFKISGKAELVKALPNMNFSPVPAVSIGFKPELVLRFTAEVELSLSVGSTTGFSYENGKGVQDLSTTPKVEIDLDAEGKVFFGIDLGPAVWILGGYLAEIKFSSLGGVELKAEMGGTAFDDFQIVGGMEIQDSIHTCESCLGITLSAKTEFSLKLEFLNLSFLKFEFKLTDKVFEIGECYYSFDQREFGWGECPNQRYRVTVYVQDAQGNDAFGIDVIAGWAEQLTEIPMGTTNGNGVVVDYLRAGTYTFMATVDGENLGKSVAVEEACKVTLDKDSIGGAPTFIFGFINPESITDNGIVASGECGADGDNVTWTLYGSGLLHIQGAGNMTNYTSSTKSPWYDYRLYISQVIIDSGVSSIGNRAFYNCTCITTVDIPNSIVSIGNRAFYSCSSLINIKIPESVRSIGSYTFYKCSGLQVVELHDDITSIADRAFSGCSSLNSITIPTKLTFLGYYAFYDCVNLENVYVTDFLSWCEITFDGYYSNPLSNKGKLFIGGILATNITLPESLLVVGDFLFHGCSSITHVYIPDGVTEIGANAFEGCDNLETVSIPANVTSIGSNVFCGSGITSCEIPDGVQVVPDLMFQWCDNLKRVVVGESVTSIGTTAFAYCSSLEEIIFKGDAPSTIEYGAFLMTPAIRYYPAENETWREFLLENPSDKWQPYTTLNTSMAVLIDDQPTGAETCLEEQSTEYVAQNSEDLDGVPSLTSIYDGEYGTQVSDSYILKTASFSGLVPGEQYVMLALVSIEVEEILAPDNLLYIEQDMAAEDGTLVFSYVQQEVTDTSYVMACGASHNDLSEALITFPAMMATEEVQAVHPTVVYDGEPLTEGLDYIIIGTVSFTEPGEYTCYIRGIYNYTGLVACQYTVSNTMPGDINGDGVVNNKDLTRLFQYLSQWDVEVTESTLDVNGDGNINNKDLTRLFQYLSGWDVEMY